MSELYQVSKKNVLWGLFNLAVSIPFFIFGLATVSYISYKKESFFDYYLEYLFQPIVIILIGLITLNTIADYIIYKQNKVFWLKKLLFISNISYIIFFVEKLGYYMSHTSDFIFFLLAFSFLLYKVFRYYFYLKKFVFKR